MSKYPERGAVQPTRGCLWDSQGRIVCSEDPYLQWVRPSPSCKRQPTETEDVVEGFAQVDPFNCDYSKYKFEVVEKSDFVRVLDYKCGPVDDVCGLYCNKACEGKKGACKFIYGNNAMRDFDNVSKKVHLTCKCKRDPAIMGQVPN